MFSFLTITALSLSASKAHSQGLCSQVLSSSQNIEVQLETEINGEWRKNQGDAYMQFRSNAPHFWNWMRQFAQNKVMSFLGVVVGDPHLLNFGDIELQDGQRKYGDVDVDDGGSNAPFFADFARFFIGNQISPYKVSANDLWNAYLDGLNDKKMEKPSFLKDILDKSDKKNTYKKSLKISALRKPPILSPLIKLRPMCKIFMRKCFPILLKLCAVTKFWIQALKSSKAVAAKI